MSISSLIESEKHYIDALSKDIKEFSLNLSISDLENDDNLIQTTTTNEFSGLSLTQLNAQVKDYDNRLDSLNKLWHIRGQIREIESFLKVDSPIEDQNSPCGSVELESIFIGLKALKGKIDQFDQEYPHSMITESLNQHYDELSQKAVEKIKIIFNMFFPDSNTFVNPIVVEGIDFEFNGEFVGVFREISYKGRPIIENLLKEKLKEWEDELLSPFLIDHKFQLELVQNPVNGNEDTIQYSLKKIPQFAFNELYFKSLTSFIKFINIFQDHNLQNFYSTKISKNLTEMVSKNISKLISNELLMQNLMDLIELAKRSNWNLSVASTLNSSNENVIDSLNELYIEWLTNEYVKKITKIYTNVNELENIFSNTMTISINNSESQPKESDDWSDEWDDEWGENDANTQQESKPENLTTKTTGNKNEDEEEDDDFLNEDWGWGDEEDKDIKITSNSKKPKLNSGDSDPKTSQEDTYTITAIPSKIKSIFTNFVKEGSLKDGPKTIRNVSLLITAVTSLSEITYPSLERSVLCYNDLVYLYELILPVVGDQAKLLIEYNNTSLIKLKYNLMPSLKEILAKISLEHDDKININRAISAGNSFDDKEFDDYDLDDEVLENLILLQQWFTKFSESIISKENPVLFKQLLVFYIDFTNDWITNTSISFNEITEYQSAKISHIIDYIQNITIPIIIDKLNRDAKNEIASIHKLENTKFLVTNHLKEIMDRFYSGEFYDYDTVELISMVKSVFVESSIRQECIEEIEMARNVDNDDE